MINKKLKVMVDDACARTNPQRLFGTVDEASVQRATLNLIRSEIKKNLDLIQKELAPIIVNKDGMLVLLDSRDIFGDSTEITNVATVECFENRFKPRSKQSNVLPAYYLFSGEGDVSVVEDWFNLDDVEDIMDDFKEDMVRMCIKDIYVIGDSNGFSNGSWAYFMAVFE